MTITKSAAFYVKILTQQHLLKDRNIIHIPIFGSFLFYK